MTREDAVTRYKAIRARRDYGEYLTEEMVEMAISALERQTGKCRTCEYGEVYNDAWCRCQHPVIKGCRVKISGGCEVEKLEKLREEYMKMRKESE